MKKKLLVFPVISILIILISTILLPHFLYAGSPSDVGAFVTRFYQTCLSRMPDPKGLNSWVNGLLSGSVTGAQVANGFIFSDELLSKNLSNEEFLNIMYLAFFNRQPDLAGFGSWFNVLANGGSRGYVLEGFVNSLEFDILCDSYGINPGSLSSSGSYYSKTNSLAAINSIENNLFDTVNRIRTQNGVRMLILDTALSNIARSRSTDMVTRNYFSHITPDGRNIFIILNEAGYPWQFAGENIFQCSPAANGTENAITSIWMSSPAHRDNILNGTYTEAGVGIIDSENTRTAVIIFSN